MISMEHKLGLIQKALLGSSGNLRDIAREGNVGYSSLQKWLRQHREGKLQIAVKAGRRTQDWTRAEQLQAVLDCESLTGESLGAYCREQGIYSTQLTEWKSKLMKENPKDLVAQHKRIQQKLEAENKELKRELRRKEKALAEASALLILKKKADLIWGKDEDD